ncbi:Putative sodium-dependent multivitamin transporter [Anthophora plagiata]
MGVVPLAIALTVSFMSAITLLGISAENYVHGTQIMLLYLGGFFGTPIVLYFYLPVFAEMNTMSVYEYLPPFQYLERRFGVRARLIASTANFTQLLLYTGVVLFAPSLALEATTGLSGDISVLFIGLICTFYSTVGGIKAVLITDVFQGVLMFVALTCVLSVAASNLDDGLSNVWSIAQEGGRIDFFKNFKSSQQALLLSGPITLLLAIFTSFSGLVLYAIYRDCDPLTSGKISSIDKIMPYFAAERMSQVPGVTGLFISGVFSASLSTISAMLNSLAAMALEDYAKPLCRKIGVQFPTEKATLIGKILVIFNGFNCLAVAFIAKSMGSLVEAAIGISGAIGGPILGIFTLGMFVEKANETGAVVGTAIALITCVWAAFGNLKTTAPPLPLSIDGCMNSTVLPDYRNASRFGDNTESSSYFYLYRISYMWYTPMGLTITLLVGYLTSLATRRIFHKDAREPDPNLFVPFLATRIRQRRQNAEKTTGSQMFVLENRR